MFKGSASHRDSYWHCRGCWCYDAKANPPAGSPSETWIDLRKGSVKSVIRLRSTNADRVVERVGLIQAEERRATTRSACILGVQLSHGHVRHGIEVAIPMAHLSSGRPGRRVGCFKQASVPHMADGTLAVGPHDHI